ncbi:E3 ubiquitin-protein ligase TRIM13-like [Argopecten irradians]|uniref:E3 ubiquitin-protein ligase TRIM13-like n=1 Tax=Argopecten irradians TaxID=31199 RepID=UPI003714E861
MATAIIQTAEDQITCTICLEIFQEPKALPCLHSFCKKCISNYIIERHSQNPHRNGYHCPVCRRYVSVPLHVKQNPKRWVDQLVSNHVISTMIDAYRTPTKTEHCKEHPQKELGHFCVDHNKFICSICCQDHRQCKYVLTQEEAQNKVERSENSDAVKLSRQSNLEQDLSLLSEQCDLLENTIDKRRNTWTFLHQSDQHLREKIIR